MKRFLKQLFCSHSWIDLGDGSIDYLSITQYRPYWTAYKCEFCKKIVVKSGNPIMYRANF